MQDSRTLVKIYTDGACSPNPGNGGWGAILIMGENRRELSGAETATTNNRMELLAAIRALQALKRPCSVELHTDSSYLRNAFAQGWLENWQRNGWRTKGGKGKVLNQDLWQELIHLAKTHQVQWHWVKAHAGHPENERADELAVEARKGLVQKDG